MLFAGIACIPLVALCDIRLTLWIGDALSRLQAKEDPAFLRTARSRDPRRGGPAGLLPLPAALVDRRRLAQGRDRSSSRSSSSSCAPAARLPRAEPLGRHRQPPDVDVENVRMLLGPGSMYVLGSLFMVPGSLFVSLRISPLVTLAMSLPLLLVAIVMMMMTPRLQRSRARAGALADCRSARRRASPASAW
jgi:hypothetical protein